MNFVIETNVPMPGGRLAPLTMTIRALNVGESFLIAGSRPNHLGNIFATQKPKKFSTRKVEGGTRIWRTK